MAETSPGAIAWYFKRYGSGLRRIVIAGGLRCRSITCGLLGRSPVPPSGRQLADGHIRMKCDVIVSGGLGCSIVPFRLGVPPEIVLVTPGGAIAAVS